MNKINISVIVPIYNLKDYIESTVKSICIQTYSNIEIILVDDGSTDGSAELIDKIAESDSRIRVIHKANGGVTSARFEGVAVATGEWIGFVDGDDYIEPDMYERLLTNAEKYSAEISHCGYQMVFPSRVDYYYNTGRLIKQDTQTGLSDLLDGLYVEPSLCNKLFHKALFQRLINKHVIDLSIKYLEDLLINYFLFKESSMSVYEDLCSYHYMVRKNSTATSAVNDQKIYDPVRVWNIILNDVDDGALKKIAYRRLGVVYLNGTSMNNPEKKEYIDVFIAKCKKELKRIMPVLLKCDLSKMAKLQYRLCLFSPTLYRSVHIVYSKIKGTDKKYEVE